ncbi:hypothetical protein KR026_005451 [Drosophila bipectinata]|nr:hypothetical protein KR026_005451 [Drosophila bipectinata]
MFGLFRKISASKVSEVILRGLFQYAKILGVIFFKPNKSKHGFFEMSCLRPFWKWTIFTCQLILLTFYIYNYILWTLDRNDSLDQVQNYKSLLLSVWSFLGLIGVKIIHGSEVIKLVNRYLLVFGRVRALPLQKKIGFGTGKELFLILLTLCCQCHEFVFYSETLLYNHTFVDILDWFSYVYVVTVNHIMMRIHFFWYLSVGVLYSDLNEYVRVEVKNLMYPQRNQRKTLRRLEECFKIYEEMSSITTSFQDIFNFHLFLTLMQIFFYVSVYSYDMIQFLDFHDIWRWGFFLKIIMDFLLLSVAIHGAVNQFKGIRGLHFEMSGFGKCLEWQKMVEVFFSHLNQFELRVTILGLFDVSMEFYLEIASGIVTYLIFVIQTVMQLENEEANV